MSKELPYFKFIVTEWLTGDIILEELDVQGLFVNICALYWKKAGNLHIDEVTKRYPNKATALAILTDRFISLNDGFLDINFLHEQLTERQLKSVTNSKNGSLGGRPKASKTQAAKPNAKRNKANDNRDESESKPTKNKIKSKNKEEDTLFTDSSNPSPKVFTDYQLCVDYWLKTFHPGWNFSAVHGKAVKSIIVKIKDQLKKSEREISPESIQETFTIICQKLPDWFKDKDLQIIDAKFNEIIEQIKKQHNGKQSDRFTKAGDAAKEAVANIIAGGGLDKK
jgi:hypothetical protein